MVVRMKELVTNNIEMNMKSMEGGWISGGDCKSINDGNKKYNMNWDMGAVDKNVLCDSVSKDTMFFYMGDVDGKKIDSEG